MDELARLQAESMRVLRDERPESPPLLFYVKPIVDYFEARLIEILREGVHFPEARPAFNPVFIHLPADGCRLTDLAEKAGMTKQAMAEIVEQLIEMGYLARFPDPSDKRAKIIVRTDKGLRAHHGTMAAFARIDAELADMVGSAVMRRLREAAKAAAEAVREVG